MTVETPPEGAALCVDEPVSMTVVDAVAGEAGVVPTELPPLAECIDPDALDVLVCTGGFTGDVEFTYHGYRVRVTGEGQVSLGDPGE